MNYTEKCTRFLTLRVKQNMKVNMIPIIIHVHMQTKFTKISALIISRL